MSTGIDKELVRDYYQRMKDAEIIRILTYDLKGLTQAAREVIIDEIKRRQLDVDVSTIEWHEEVEPPPMKVYDPDGCPVEEPTRIWLEQSFLTLLQLFGEANTRDRKVLIPERIDFPVRYDGSERAAFETLQIVARQMEVPADSIILDFYDENLRQRIEGTPGGFYWGKGKQDTFEISIARKYLDEPENMVAVLAHEIAHIKLLGESRMEKNDEPITDLTTIFFGLGIFNANAAFQTFADSQYYGWSTSGYLTQMEWGYALALFAYIRQEQQPAWATHLCKNVKSDFIQGCNFIAVHEDEIFQEG